MLPVLAMGVVEASLFQLNLSPYLINSRKRAHHTPWSGAFGVTRSTSGLHTVYLPFLISNGVFHLQ